MLPTKTKYMFPENHRTAVCKLPNYSTFQMLK